MRAPIFSLRKDCCRNVTRCTSRATSLPTTCKNLHQQSVTNCCKQNTILDVKKTLSKCAQVVKVYHVISSCTLFVFKLLPNDKSKRTSILLLIYAKRTFQLHRKRHRFQFVEKNYLITYFCKQDCCVMNR